ncbi:MAG: ABC transporter substrate-binding protein [Ruminococcus sp.]|nr:ABC transporter substrate-binding protein [Ruminococcus sp.]
MKNLKKLLAAMLAVSMTFALAACSDDDSEDASSHEDTVQVVSTDDIEPIADGEETTLLWMANYDLNPTSDDEKTVGLTLFEEKGGSIEWSRVTSSNQFTKLAAAVTSGKDVPDLFASGSFPYQVLQGFYQPVDDVVDFDDPLWVDVKSTADQYVLNGKHYVAPIEFSPAVYIFYDKNTIVEEGLDDPQDLYYAGEWDYDAMDDLMSEYVNNAEGDEVRYGINGYYAPSYIQQTGETLVMVDDDGTYYSNLDSAAIAKAEERLYNWQKNGYVEASWIGSAADAFNAGCLFYAMGSWAATGDAGPSSGESWGIVPVPSDPDYDGDLPLVSATMTAYWWVKGSTKTDAVRCFYECYRIAQTDETYKQNVKDKWLEDNPNWTEDDYDLMMELSDPDQNLMIFDPAYGVSALMGDDNSGFHSGESLANYLYKATSAPDQTTGNILTWTQTKETYSATVESEVETLNESIASFTE